MQWQDIFDDCLSLLTRQTAVIGLRAPAFCSFEEMKHFEGLLVLN